MANNNIERNSMDYILTDILPVEISELFTYRYFYSFLVSNNKLIDKILENIIKLKNDTNMKMKLFESNHWVSMPLKYSIMKAHETTRELNVVQPIAAVEIYLFISAFQKEIINSLENKSLYSIRYHRKANDLYYKKKKKNTTHYFSSVSEELKRGIIEQTGMFFDLKPFQSIVSFTSSDKWFDLNLKYKYFAKLDYKACFDSIYTHTYKWLISRDVNDSKQFKNTNLFTTIDRIMQNINASTSNGIVVGPEFSRLIAELLLQGIDSIIYNTLMNHGYIHEQNYSISRYVDDIFIFAESEDLLEKIIKLFNDISQKYMLRLNESKIIKYKLPCVLNPWLNQASEYATNLSNTMFYTDKEIKEFDYSDEKPYIFKTFMFFRRKSTLKRNFNDLICLHKNNQKTLVSYVFGTLLNKISHCCGECNIFKSSVTENTIYAFLDYVFYVYSHFPNFDNTQKLVSIISYIDDEFKLNTKNTQVLQKIFEKYSYIFDKSNINDVINLILLCAKCSIEIPYAYENKILKTIKDEDNPIIWASYFLYSRYETSYYREIKKMITQIINNKMESILKKKNISTYREFWWLLVFNKCPFIDKSQQDLFDDIVKKSVKINNARFTSEICINLVADFLLNNNKQFFEWDIDHNDLLKQITFRTQQRTVFKNYKYGQIEYCSID